MKNLIVREPWSSQIVAGSKNIEYRKRATAIRGRIGIITGGTKSIIGSVELFDCRESDEGGHEWLLREPRKYKKPVPYIHKNGQQVWVLTDFSDLSISQGV